MSKKQKKINSQIAEEESQKQDQISEGVVYSDQDAKATAKRQQKELKKLAKEEKSAQKQKEKNKDKKKKPKEKKGGLIKKSKETVSELKKVTWPTFGEVVKKTGVVVAFVAIAGVFLYGVNFLLGWLVGLLV